MNNGLDDGLKRRRTLTTNAFSLIFSEHRNIFLAFDNFAFDAFSSADFLVLFVFAGFLLDEEFVLLLIYK